MKQRGMTHQRKQALADHAIAGCTLIRPHLNVTAMNATAIRVTAINVTAINVTATGGGGL